MRATPGSSSSDIPSDAAIRDAFKVSPTFGRRFSRKADERFKLGIARFSEVVAENLPHRPAADESLRREAARRRDELIAARYHARQIHQSCFHRGGPLTRGEARRVRYNAEGLLSLRPIRRQGREPRVRRNARARGSRRATGSRAGPGDPDGAEGDPGALKLWESPWGPVSPNLYRALLRAG